MSTRRFMARGQAMPPFVGRSVVDELCRGIDWARNPVGTPDTWPPTWRAAMRMALDSFMPMVLLFGKEFVMIYNDACIPVVGGKHPRCLGGSAPAEWPEIWSSVIEPMVQHVITTGDPAGSEDLYLPLERNGYPEETHMIFGVSAVREDDGAPTALLVTLRETTERVLVARQVECLDALSTRCFPAETPEEAARIAAEVMDRYPRDLPFTLTYLVEADRRHARRVAHSGLTSVMAEVAPPVVSLNGEGSASGWDIARVIETGVHAETTGIRDRVTPYLRRPELAPVLALTLPLADPSGGIGGVLIAGTNAMRPPEDGRKLATAVAARLTTAVANAKVKQQERTRVEALAELDRAKTLFLSDVSHEFRTPLTLLLSPLDEVLSRPAMPSGDRELLQTSRRAATRLLRLVQSLLDFSRVEAGRMQAAFEPTDLGALTADVASLFRSTFERARIQLIVDSPSLPEPVHIDRDMWEKIVLNLLSNAFKFTLVGEVNVHLGLQGEWVVLKVGDTGCGIAPDDVPHVFERFRRGRTERARTAEGSGIGLSLVQELVKLHSGKIELSSEVDKGTTFTVRIPRGTKHLPAEQIGVPRRQGVAAGAAPYIEEVSGWIGESDTDTTVLRTQRGKPRPAKRATQPAESAERILVVDDNSDMRGYLRRILQKHWKVDTASDGMIALSRVRKSAPDLVIADMMMPGLDGLSLLRAMRDDSVCAELPVMVLSARTNEDASIDALNAGADDYLPKPFSSRELVARVAVQLARARLRAAERAAREVAEQTSFMKDELVLILTNSLRNPLNVMVNAIGLLKDHNFGGEEARRALDLIRASSREQHRLIDEVHDVSCMAAGCFNIEQKRIACLSESVTAEIEALRPVAGARRVRLESFIDTGAGPVDGDEARLRQVVHNLVAHALASTPPNGSVLVECRGRRDHVEVVVRDNGMGIAPDALRNVFDPLWQMHHARTDASRAGGVWLGLAVIHRIVELHGGRIIASSDGHSMGAVFTVRLPLAVAVRIEQQVNHVERRSSQAC